MRQRPGSSGPMTTCDAGTEVEPGLAARNGIQRSRGDDGGGLKQQRRRRGTGPMLHCAAKCDAGAEACFASSARVGREEAGAMRARVAPGRASAQITRYAEARYDRTWLTRSLVGGRPDG